MQATLSLMGLYNFYPELFDGFNFPTKWTVEDQDNFINKLLFDTAELEILYPEPIIMNTAMKTWSRAMLPNWDKLYDTTQFDYNPIWNKDGVITESEKIGRNNSFKDQRDSSQKAQNTTTNNLLQNINTNQETNDSGTQKDYVFGFNENTAAQSGQHETENNETIKGTSSQTNTGTVADNGNSSANEVLNHTGADDENREYTRKEQGNIGITTTQQMILEEREVDEFNLMDYIIDSFKQRFCILVY